jgi:hypothetical protein
MSVPDADCRTQIEAAYRAMAREARYRPCAPSDGLGNITAPESELDLDAEARSYAEEWWRQEDDCTYTIGCANYPDRPAMIYALEAARLCCGFGGRRYALRLLEMAARELRTEKPA